MKFARLIVSTVPAFSFACYQQPSSDGDDAATDPSGPGSGTAASADDDDDDGDPDSAGTVSDSLDSGPSSDDNSDDPTAVDDSTGDVPAACADGTAQPGELCLATTATVFAVGGELVDVVVGEFDGQAGLDIGALDPTNNAVQLLYNDGAGAFPGSLTLTVTESAYALRAGDAEGDGDDDIVVAGIDFTAFIHDGVGVMTATTSPNDGLGGGSYNGLEIFQGDADPSADVMVSSAYNHSFAPGGVSGNAWSFGDKVSDGVPGEGAGGMSGTEFGFDGDGFSDVVGLNVYYAQAYILLGNGDGTFADHATVPFACAQRFTGASAVVTGEIDGAGDVDFVVTCVDQSGFVVVHGNSDGTFAADPMTVLMGASRPRLADLDADGDLDLVVSTISEIGDAGTLEVFLNAGDGTFASTLSVPNPGPSTSVAIGDVDGDGAPDLVTAYLSSVSGAGEVAVVFSDP
jgi:hypothetical protein